MARKADKVVAVALDPKNSPSARRPLNRCATGPPQEELCLFLLTLAFIQKHLRRFTGSNKVVLCENYFDNIMLIKDRIKLQYSGCI